MCTQVFDQKVGSKRAIEGEKEREFGARERESRIGSSIRSRRYEFFFFCIDFCIDCHIEIW